MRTPSFSLCEVHTPLSWRRRLPILLVAGLLGACAGLAPDGVIEDAGRDETMSDSRTTGQDDGTSVQEASSAGDDGVSSPDSSFGSDSDAMVVEDSTPDQSVSDAAVEVPAFNQSALLEIDSTALAGLDLESALFLASGAEASKTDSGRYPYYNIFNSFLERLSGNPRCNSESIQTSIGAGDVEFHTYGLEGFKIECPLPTENIRQVPPSEWHPISVANRFDLAPERGEYCGEQHVSFHYGSESPDEEGDVTQAYMMLSALVPNPTPDKGIEGCRPLVEFWRRLGQPEVDAATRAKELRLAFLGKRGDTPDGGTEDATDAPAAGENLAAEALIETFGVLLGSDKFAPDNLGRSGRLQLAFRDHRGVWVFSQFQLVGGAARRMQLSQTIGVRDLFGGVAGSLRATCRQTVIQGMEGLLESSFPLRTVDIPKDCQDAEELSTDVTFMGKLPPDGDGLLWEVDAFLKKSHPQAEITVEELAERADRTATCVGCHHERIPSETYLHVTHPDGCTDCTSRISSRLERELLPYRKRTMQNFLSHTDQRLPPTAPNPSTRTIGGARWVPGSP